MNSMPLLETKDNLPAEVAMTMTLRAHNAAERAGVVGIEVNPDAMATVAHHIGAIAHNRAELLPPQFLVVRDGGAWRRKDAQLPFKVDASHDPVYTWATDLGEPIPRIAKYPELKRMASVLGAAALTEMTVWKWDEHALTSAYAAGLLFNYVSQKPIYRADERPPLVVRAARDVADTVRRRTDRKLKLHRQVRDLVENYFIHPVFTLHRR